MSYHTRPGQEDLTPIDCCSDPDLLDRISHDGLWSERSDVARNPYAYPHTLIRLASDSNWIVRGDVKNNPATPPLVKLYLQSDQYSGMTLGEFLEAAK